MTSVDRFVSRLISHSFYKRPLGDTRSETRVLTLMSPPMSSQGQEHLECRVNPFSLFFVRFFVYVLIL